ncbi:MAG TPA: DNA helicase RecQ [Solidesulfovibrio sp.]|nr:DNA helicase RecQ [Desulfovibrio sp.]HML60962.1 DNA helicase RecQ [Solidesulfovibrio sp.]
MSTPRDILKQVFGYDRFRGPQQEVIDHVCAGGDALVVMPTGGGKSLCYQIPALLLPGTAVVVSPLIALMRDQVRALDALGVAAAALHSGLAPGEAREVTARLASGRLDILYAAPERVMTPAFAALLESVPLALFAIDEAHCVSQWGHEFRPEYLQLAQLASRFPGTPRLALTATADGPTRDDILVRLELRRARVFATGFDRPNIRYRVEAKDHPRRRLLRFIQDEHPGQSGIVYRLSRRKVEDLAEWLTAHGVPALAYHAGLSAAERDARQDRFMREEGLVMAATVAFGMGVDKPDVRFVAHLDPPKSLEAYHQETGRAGRDGEPAEALLLHAPADFVALRHLIDPEGTGEGRRRVELSKLDAMAGYCECDACRRGVLLGYFGQALDAPCGNCDICLDPQPSVDATVPAQKALSCVFRTGQRFGAGHIVDVLLGKPTTRAVTLGHTELSTFGIGAELTKDQWKAVMRRLAAMGALAPHPEGHGGLVLAPAAWDILKGRREFSMRLPEAAVKTPGGRTGGRTRRRETGPLQDWIRETLPTPDDLALWEALRAWRAQTAREAGVPPYVVFQDRTLVAVAAAKPETAQALADLPGMGRAKLEKYGHELLAILDTHCAAHGRRVSDVAIEPAEAVSRREAREKSPSATAAESLRLFRECGTAEEVAAQRGLALTTVHGHLLFFVRRGELAACEAAGLDAATAARAEEIILDARRARTMGLTPVYDALGGEVSYDALRHLEAGLWADGRLGDGR